MPTATAATAVAAEQPGPPPSFIQVARPFVFEQKIKSQILSHGTNPAREDNFRLQGIQWIDDVRRALQLPVRTFNTAAVYYHKFRLVHRDNEYQYIDAAGAALFAACKIEDTLKKSREILCAAHNLKASANEQLTADNNIFESPSRTIIGLERLMLEASTFDYRNRYPQPYLMKLAPLVNATPEITRTAYKMLLDLYRTFSPLKATSCTMAFACLELTRRVIESPDSRPRGPDAEDYANWKTSRQQVMEVMLDLLDLYTHFPKQSILGQVYAVDTFIHIRILLNKEAEERKLPRYTDIRDKPAVNGFNRSNIKTPKTPITPASPTDVRTNGNSNGHQAAAASPVSLSPKSAGSGRRGVGARGQDGTVRFMLDSAQARRENAMVGEYFKTEYEEVEVEVDEEPEPARGPRDSGDGRRDYGSYRDGGGGGRRGGGGMHDSRDSKRLRR